MKFIKKVLENRAFLTKWSTLFSVIILALVYFYLQNNKSTNKKEFLIFNFNAENVTWWQVENAIALPNEPYPEPQPLLRIEKIPIYENKETWQITSPINTAADENEATANIRNLASLISTKKIGDIKKASEETQTLFNSPKAPRVSFGIKQKNNSTDVHTIIVGRHMPEINTYEIIVDEQAYFSPEPFVLALMKTRGMLKNKNFLQIEPRIISWIAIYHNNTSNNYIVFKNNLNYLASPLGSEKKVLKNLQLQSSGNTYQNNKIEKIIQTIGFLRASQEVVSNKEKNLVLTRKNLLTTFHIRTSSHVRYREIALCIFTADNIPYAASKNIFEKTIVDATTEKPFPQLSAADSFAKKQKNGQTFCQTPKKNLATSPLYRIEEGDISSLSSTLSSLTM